MKGLLIDEEEFQISPAITRQVTMFESGHKKQEEEKLHHNHQDQILLM